MEVESQAHVLMEGIGGSKRKGKGKGKERNEKRQQQASIIIMAHCIQAPGSLGESGQCKKYDPPPPPNPQILPQNLLANDHEGKIVCGAKMPRIC